MNVPQKDKENVPIMDSLERRTNKFDVPRFINRTQGIKHKSKIHYAWKGQILVIVSRRTINRKSPTFIHGQLVHSILCQIFLTLII